MAKVVFLLANKFEDSEMDNPYQEVKKAGHEAVIAGLKRGEQIDGKKGSKYISEIAASELNVNDYDAVVIPGGGAPEALRVDASVVSFIQKMNERSKTIAGICHGPQVMISANILNNKKATCYVGIRDDVRNAGAEYADKEVVVDGHLITSRTPADEPAFIREILKQLK